MNNLKPEKKTIAAGVTISILLHVIILLVFAFLKFSDSSSARPVHPTPTAKIEAVSKLLDRPQILPKPKIARTSAKAAILMPKIKSSPANKTPLAAGQIGYETSKLVTKKISYDKLQPEKVNIEFFGNAITTARLCFVVDCSGSMQGVFEKVKRQLKNSILPLEPDSYFEIIFFGNNRLYCFSQNRLQRASGPTKQKAIDFIDQIEPVGQTNATEALTAAVKCKDFKGNSPDIIYFLTDGFDLNSEQNDEFTENITALRNNYCPQAKINTIAFWPKAEDRIILTQLSLVTGGKFKTAALE